MKLLKFLCLIIILQVSSTVYSEDLPVVEYNPSSGRPEWFHFESKTASAALKSASLANRKKAAYQAGEKFISDVAGILKVKNPRKELSTVSYAEDKSGMQILRYSQILNGVKVLGAELLVRADSSGSILDANGNILEDLEIDTRPKINKYSAEAFARKAMAEKYGRQVARKNIRRFKRDNTFVVTASDLLIYNDNFLNGKAGGKTLLAWRVGVKDRGVNGEQVFINAKNGSFITSISASHNATQRWIYDCSNPKGDGFCYSRLGPELDPPYLDYAPYTFGRREDAPERGPNPLPLPNPSAGSTDVDLLYNTAGNDIQPGIKSLYRFYHDKFGRNGANGFGGGGEGECPSGNCPGIVGIGVPLNQFRALTNLNGIDLGQFKFCNPGNAQFTFYPLDNAVLKFCRGSASSDIIGHEFTHMIAFFNNYTVPGVYHGVMQGGSQSGSLNEGFADIMGLAFKNYLINGFGAMDWVIGTGTNLRPRSLSNPTSKTYIDVDGQAKPYPDRFHSDLVYCASNDSGGVHVNHLIPGYGTYLAAEGGSFNGCQIEGIGIEKAIQIWYRAVTTIFTNTTSFFQAYNGLIQACNDLKNNTSLAPPTMEFYESDCVNLTKALQAVELNQPGKCSGQPAQIPECAQQATPTAAPTETATATPTETPKPIIPGDYNLDGSVSMEDYYVWKQQYGNTGPGYSADGNHDGSVNAADYTVWRDNLGRTY